MYDFLKFIWQKERSLRDNQSRGIDECEEIVETRKAQCIELMRYWTENYAAYPR